jgi:hypothetical protein
MRELTEQDTDLGELIDIDEFVGKCLEGDIDDSTDMDIRSTITRSMTCSKSCRLIRQPVMISTTMRSLIFFGSQNNV